MERRHLTGGVSTALILVLGAIQAQAATFVWLDELDISKAEAGWGTSRRNRSVEGNPLRIGGQEFERGLGTHAPAAFWIQLDGWTSHFYASVGVDDEVGRSPASVEFLVVGKGEVLWRSGIMRAGDPPKKVEVLTRGVKKLGLLVTEGPDNNHFDHANWAEARFRVTGQPPKALARSSAEPYILTPKPPKTPRINGARVFGARPGSPFLFTIPATGERPMRFGATDLPPGLVFDTTTGRITGRCDRPGTYAATLTAENALGKDEKPLKIVIGEQICLTPPLGWNSWNCWAGAVDAEKIKAAAQAMVDTGLIQHGWTYINIDDTWQGRRGGPFNAIQGNEKFPDMKGLCDAVHELGLKIGIYSTPWVTSYAGYIGGSSDNPDGAWDPENEPRQTGWRHGKVSFAENDARQWAAWGMDYLKYDWNPNDVPHVTEMARALRASGRDIVYSLSNSAPFEHAADWARLAHCWRTTGDIVDSWGSVSSIGFSQDRWAPFAGPGHWNDADMLVVGYVGWGPSLHPTNLSPDEQYTHISLWCLLSSPMLLGCDLTRLDEFTLSLLTNDEVLAVNQDPLGEQARRVAHDQDSVIWAKTMADGSKAVGLFDRGLLFDEPREITVTWEQLGLSGRQRVRDLWRQQDLGVFGDAFTATVPPHGVVLIRVQPEDTGPR